MLFRCPVDEHDGCDWFYTDVYAHVHGNAGLLRALEEHLEHRHPHKPVDEGARALHRADPPPFDKVCRTLGS